jgi:hypothetical protein
MAEAEDPIAYLCRFLPQGDQENLLPSNDSEIAAEA